MIFTCGHDFLLHNFSPFWIHKSHFEINWFIFYIKSFDGKEDVWNFCCIHSSCDHRMSSTKLLVVSCSSISSCSLRLWNVSWGWSSFWVYCCWSKDWWTSYLWVDTKHGLGNIIMFWVNSWNLIFMLVALNIFH